MDNDHNVFDYLSFMMHLQDTDDFDYTPAEKFVSDRLRVRACSLARVHLRDCVVSPASVRRRLGNACGRHHGACEVAVVEPCHFALHPYPEPLHPHRCCCAALPRCTPCCQDRDDHSESTGLQLSLLAGGLAGEGEGADAGAPQVESRWWDFFPLRQAMVLQRRWVVFATPAAHCARRAARCSLRGARCTLRTLRAVLRTLHAAHAAQCTFTLHAAHAFACCLLSLNAARCATFTAHPPTALPPTPPHKHPACVLRFPEAAVKCIACDLAPPRPLAPFRGRLRRWCSARARSKVASSLEDIAERLERMQRREDARSRRDEARWQEMQAALTSLRAAVAPGTQAND